MPTRPTIVVILVGWTVAAAGLFHRDILPDFRNTPPPDLRSIAGAGEDAGPTTWFVSVAEKEGLRPVGRATTDTRRQADGSTTLNSTVSFDSNGLLKGTPFAFRVEDQGPAGHLTITNSCAIDPGGNLRQFRVNVFATGDAQNPLMTIDARGLGRKIEVHARSPYLNMEWSKSFDYEPRGLIQNGIGPTDRLPGLQVGQRWQTEVVNPMTGGVGKALTEVTRKHSIQWNNLFVPTLEVVQTMGSFTARTWVRPDGLVLRQEVPLPIVRLILERAPTGVGSPGTQGTKAP